MVPLTHGVWAEVRTLALGEVEEPTLNRNGDTLIPCGELSYFSRLLDAEAFTTAAYVEVYRRGVESAGAVVAVSDGAEWCQRFVAFHRPDAVRILDFPHAAQRVGEVGRIGFASAENPARKPRNGRKGSCTR